MQCHVIILDTTGTTYTIYEIGKRKETIKEKTDKKWTNRKRKTKKIKTKTRSNNMSCPPPAGEVANTRKITSWRKRKKKDRNTTACEQRETTNQEKRKENNKITKPKARACWRQQLVCGISSIARFSPANLPGTLLPGLPSPPWVHQLCPAPWRQTIRNEQSSFVIQPRHTAPSVRLINQK